jgi:hypothetical protein
MPWLKIAAVVCLFVLIAGVGLAWDANNPPPKAPNRNPSGAMWLSIAHPGVGEWYNAGWGGWSKCNQKKFWLGFIPFYGWPGYLQVKSAVTARRGGTW